MRERTDGPATGGVDGLVAAKIGLSRWLRGACGILRVDAGCILFCEKGMVRLISQVNIPYAFLVSAPAPTKLPYRHDETVLLLDANKRPDVQALVSPVFAGPLGFYYRQPLHHSSDRTVALLLFGREPRDLVSKRERAALAAIEAALREIVEQCFPLERADTAASMRVEQAEIAGWLEHTRTPAMLLDDQMRLCAVNDPMRALHRIDWDDLIGCRIFEIDLTGREGVDRLFRQALRSGLSTPPIEVMLRQDAAIRSLRIVGSPLQLRDGGSLVIAAAEKAGLAERRQAPFCAAEPAPIDPSAEFLIESLVHRRALRARNAMSYITLRSWRRPIRDHQIRAFKSLKRFGSAALAAAIAREMAADIEALFGAQGLRGVVPMPCGHSLPGRCFSHAIAQALAAQLSLPVIHAVAIGWESGSSHPKRNVERGRMQLVAPVDGTVALVDDVATSGAHLEEATALMRGAGASVLAYSWIGGDA